MAFGQEGRKSIVYQLQQVSGQARFALKVFKKRFRGPYLSHFTTKIGRYAHLSGMEVCRRTTLRADTNRALVDKFPDLEYATLMPWVMADTWSDIVTKRTALSRSQALRIAASLASILAGLEREHLAHCDISSFNVMMNLGSSQVSLVDVEDLYGPDFVLDDNYPTGTTGYHHRAGRKAPKGQWCAEGDRFSGSVLLSEILCWHDPQVRSVSEDEHFFDGAELQDPSCSRYQLMSRVLRDISEDLSTLFQHSWCSASLAHCPPLARWDQVLKTITPPTPFQFLNTIFDRLGFRTRAPAPPASPSQTSVPTVPQVPIRTTVAEALARLAPSIPSPFYTTLATSSAPALIIYLIDLSRSMGQTSGGVRKIDAVAAALGETITAMIQRSTKGTVVIDRYRLGVYGYHSQVVDILGGIKGISQLRSFPKFPMLGYGAAASLGFLQVERILKQELLRFPNSPAPLVCHLTDGIFAGEDPQPIVSRIQQMAVLDGRVLVDNIFISKSVLRDPVLDVHSWGGIKALEQIHTDKKYARQLFAMSSVIPDSYLGILQEFGYNLEPGARMLFPGGNTEILRLGFVMSGATPVTK
jgi:serine/threonine protein kinase